MTGKYDPRRIPAYNTGSAFKLGAGLGSGYGFRKDPIKRSGETSESEKSQKPKFHSGQDFVAPAGTPVPNAAPGVVVYSGLNKELGNAIIVRNDRGDYSLYGHMQDGGRAQLGQRIEEGDTIGHVGGTGERSTGVHLHYSVIRPEAGKIIERGPGNGGPIGIHLDGFTTNDPVGLPRYPNETNRAVGVMSGGTTVPGTPPPDRPGDRFFNPFNRTIPDPAAAQPSAPPNLTPFVDRFGKWGSAPASSAPSVSDDPANFSDRFGDWAIAPGGVLGNIGATLRLPDPGQRSDLPDGVTPASATAVADRAPTPVPVRRLVNLSTSIPNDTPPVAPASSLPSLGIVSGKPMRIIRCGLRSSIPTIDHRPRTMSYINAGCGGWMPEQMRHRAARTCRR